MDNVLDLLSQLIEAVKDLKYLTKMQIVESVVYTASAGLGAYDFTHHDIKLTVISALSAFAIHIRGLMQASPSHGPKKLAAVMNANPDVSFKDAVVAINATKYAGNKDVQEAIANKSVGTTDDVLNSYIKDQSK